MDETYHIINDNLTMNNKTYMILLFSMCVIILVIIFKYFTERKNIHGKIYISFTTIPSRMNNIKPLLDSLINQTIHIDAIIFNIPYYSKRFNTEYIIPNYLYNYHPRLRINRCEDYGPGTKLLGPLETRKYNNNDVIIILDDDRLIDSNLCHHLYQEYTQHSDSIISNFGNTQQLHVKIPMGAAGILIPLHSIDVKEIFSYFKEHEQSCRYVDDIFWYKYFSQKNNIPIHYLPSSTRINGAYNDSNALFRETGHLARYNLNNSIGLNQKCLDS